MGDFQVSNDPNDIVARLRDCTCVPHGDICREAADEIERLRDERDALLEERGTPKIWFEWTSVHTDTMKRFLK